MGAGELGRYVWECLMELWGCVKCSGQNQERPKKPTGALERFGGEKRGWEPHSLEVSRCSKGL